MTRLKILGVAAILAAALASPAIAQQVAPKSTATGDSQRQITHRHHATMQNRHFRSSYNRRVDERRADRSNRFGPGDVAAGAVGGAVATAGAIATAPFRAGNAYAYDNGNNDYYGYGYGGRDLEGLCGPQWPCLRARHVGQGRGWPAVSLPISPDRPTG